MPYTVEFDENVNGNNCFGNCKVGFGLWCYKEDLELVEEKSNKDFVLQKGDKVIFKNKCNQKNYTYVEDYDGMTIKDIEGNKIKVLKVERPETYKTVYEVKEEILDKEEKEYLSAVIRPFRDKVKNIIKHGYYDEYISINCAVCSDSFNLPVFKKDTMYKNMEVDKEYTLEELGLQGE